jgi:hypothetical protein
MDSTKRGTTGAAQMGRAVTALLEPTDGGAPRGGGDAASQRRQAAEALAGEAEREAQRLLRLAGGLRAVLDSHRLRRQTAWTLGQRARRAARHKPDSAGDGKIDLQAGITQ